MAKDLKNMNDDEVAQTSTHGLYSSNLAPITEMIKRTKNSINELTKAINTYSKSAEIFNKRIYHLNWVLTILTIGLFAFAIITFFK